MACTGARLDVLLICSWQADARELRDTISAAGYEPALRRVDFESALRAVVVGRFDIAGYVPTPGLKRETVESVLREHAPAMPLVAADTPEELAREIIRALELRSS
jgi:hypothetical protein